MARRGASAYHVSGPDKPSQVELGLNNINGDDLFGRSTIQGAASTMMPVKTMAMPPHCASDTASRSTRRAHSVVTTPKAEAVTAAISLPGPWLPANSNR